MAHGTYGHRRSGSTASALRMEKMIVELGCPPNCNKTVKQKNKDQRKKLKKCGKKPLGSCKVKNRKKRKY